MSNTPTLSAKRQRFVEEYLVDFNGTQAAIRAGYSKGTAKVTASRLLTNANVAAALAVGRERLSQTLEITAEKVLSELGQLAFGRVSDFLSVDAGGNLMVDKDALADPRKSAAIAQIDIQTSADGSQAIKIKLADKKAALIELGRHLDLFTDKSREPAAPLPDEKPDYRKIAMNIMFLIRQAQEEAKGREEVLEIPYQPRLIAAA